MYFLLLFVAPAAAPAAGTRHDDGEAMSARECQKWDGTNVPKQNEPAHVP